MSKKFKETQRKLFATGPKGSVNFQQLYSSSKKFSYATYATWAFKNPPKVAYF